MSTMEHPLFGEIRYDLSWEGELNINIFGEIKRIVLYIHGDEVGEFNAGQTNVFASFMNRESELLQLSENAVYEYYLDTYMEIRDMVGEDMADKIAPHINNREELAKLIEPTHLLIREVFSDGLRVVGLLFDCTWDTSHGLAVKFENEHIVEVGSQDIVL